MKQPIANHSLWQFFFSKNRLLDNAAKWNNLACLANQKNRSYFKTIIVYYRLFNQFQMISPSLIRWILFESVTKAIFYQLSTVALKPPWFTTSLINSALYTKLCFEKFGGNLAMALESYNWLKRDLTFKFFFKVRT